MLDNQTVAIRNGVGGETGEKELKMAKGIRGSKQDKGIGDSWCDLV